MEYLSAKNSFPDPRLADDDGLLAIGGDLSVHRLIEAYQKGIFPWYEEGQPILWWSPNPRMILYLDKFKVSKSFSQWLKNTSLKVTFNTNFSKVIENCSVIKRKDQAGTWITLNMINAYQKLHELGHAKSVEVWKDDILVGGLYGIDLPEKRIFCGESMFSKETNASKLALFHFVDYLKEKKYRFIDCQMHTPHLESLGACEISRNEFLNYLDTPKSPFI